MAKKIKDFVTKEGSKFKIGDVNLEVMTAEMPWSLKKLTDSTLRFEVRKDDFWIDDFQSNHGTNRAELKTDANPPNKVIICEWDFLIEPGTNVSTMWNVLGQYHSWDDDGVVPPPMALQLYTDATTGLEMFTIALKSGGYNNLIRTYPWRAPATRNKWYKARWKGKMMENDSGYVNFWLNGTQIVDFSGPLGYGNNSYWKFGIYRNISPETMALRVRNFDFDVKNDNS